MSWAAHNPEKYDEICRKGIAARIQSALIGLGTEPGEIDLDFLESMVLAIQEDPDGGKAYDGLLDWSCQKISEEERDYFASQTDAAYERGKQ